jgi:hypothetical protein
MTGVSEKIATKKERPEAIRCRLIGNRKQRWKSRIVTAGSERTKCLSRLAETATTNNRTNEVEKMNLLKRIATAALPVLAVAVLAAVLATAVPASAVPHTVTNKVYDAWVVTSFNPADTAPFHDCARFTANTMCLDQCGDCGALTEAPLGGGATGTIWHGKVPCAGLNLEFLGTAVDGISGIGTMGASGIGHSQSSNFGLTGAQNSACALAVPANSAKNPYNRGQ